MKYKLTVYNEELYFVNDANELYVVTRANKIKLVHRNVRGNNGFPIVYDNKFYFVANNVSSCSAYSSTCGDELYYLSAIIATTTSGTTTAATTTDATATSAPTSGTTTAAPGEAAVSAEVQVSRNKMGILIVFLALFFIH